MPVFISFFGFFCFCSLAAAAVDRIIHWYMNIALNYDTHFIRSVIHSISILGLIMRTNMAYSSSFLRFSAWSESSSPGWVLLIWTPPLTGAYFLVYGFMPHTRTEYATDHHFTVDFSTCMQDLLPYQCVVNIHWNNLDSWKIIFKMKIYVAMGFRFTIHLFFWSTEPLTFFLACFSSHLVCTFTLHSAVCSSAISSTNDIHINTLDRSQNISTQLFDGSNFISIPLYDIVDSIYPDWRSI